MRAPLADGFDYPVGKPDGDGYFIQRGFRPNYHMGEDWNGRGGGNTDLGDPVYSIADGMVVYSKNYGGSWGNFLVVRHAFRETDGRIHFVDSVYAHLDVRSVEKGALVNRGQKVGTIGTAGGRYTAHLHFEIRKNLNIGTNQRGFARDYSNYWSPKPFMDSRRSLRKEFRKVAMPVNTFSGDRISNIIQGRELPDEAMERVEEDLERGVNRQIRSILQKYQLGNEGRHRSSGRASRDEDPALRDRETPGAEEERAKIYNFWQKFRGKIQEESTEAADGARSSGNRL